VHGWRCLRALGPAENGAAWRRWHLPEPSIPRGHSCAASPPTRLPTPGGALPPSWTTVVWHSSEGPAPGLFRASVEPTLGDPHTSRVPVRLDRHRPTASHIQRPDSPQGYHRAGLTSPKPCETVCWSIRAVSRFVETNMLAGGALWSNTARRLVQRPAPREPAKLQATRNQLIACCVAARAILIPSRPPISENCSRVAQA
jgi:hypothetical protein